MTNAQIPSKKECLAILKKNKTPSNVVEHCKTVCKVAEYVADKLAKKGLKINKKLVVASALLHDIKRGSDNHIIEGTKLLKSIGFLDISEVVRKHGLYKIENDSVRPKTIEEKIVFYADKRVKGNKVVSLKERIKDLNERYKKD